MDKENKVLDEDMGITKEGKDTLKEAIEERFQKLQLQSMLLGGQTTCQVILDKITMFEIAPGKRSLNDHRRLIKDIKKFCETAVSRTVNEDGTTSSTDDNSTKLTEEENE